MAKNLIATHDALDQAEGVNDGLEAIVSLLFSANDADVPNGRAIGELLLSVQQRMAQSLRDAKAGLRDAN